MGLGPHAIKSGRGQTLGRIPVFAMTENYNDISISRAMLKEWWIRVDSFCSFKVGVGRKCSKGDAIWRCPDRVVVQLR